MRELAETIKELREAKGTQTAVADKLKAAGLRITSQQLGKYESGEYKPKIDFYDTWFQVYGEDIKEIQKGNVQRNVSRGAEKPTPVQKIGDNKINEEDVYRNIVEGRTDYLLIHKSVLREQYRLVPLEQFARDEKELERRDEQIKELTNIIKQMTGVGTSSKVSVPTKTGKVKEG
jgi:transcriptional regulator with XRE-family HTH domain